MIQLSPLFSTMVVYVVDSFPRHIFSLVFQGQAIPGQGTKAGLSHSPVDSDGNEIKSGTTPKKRP